LLLLLCLEIPVPSSASALDSSTISFEEFHWSRLVTTTTTTKQLQNIDRKGNGGNPELTTPVLLRRGCNGDKKCRCFLPSKAWLHE
jgi:hypothetical protein